MESIRKYFDNVEEKKVDGEWIRCTRGWVEYGLMRECRADKEYVNTKNSL